MSNEYSEDNLVEAVVHFYKLYRNWKKCL